MCRTSAASGRLRLILVDDHDRARAAFAQRLAADPRVEVAGATARLDEAVDIVLRERPHVALVDTRRQDGRGLEFVSALATTPVAVRPLVAVHLSFFDAEQWLHAQTAGAREWVLKGFDVEATVLRLVEAIARELPEDHWRSAT